MYLDTDEITRPVAPPDVPVVKGILSFYRFLFLDTPGHYCMRKYRCWCKSSALVSGRGDDCLSRGQFLDVPSCWRSKLTFWKEDQLTVLPGQGIKQSERRVAVWIVRELPKAKSGAWGCV